MVELKTTFKHIDENSGQRMEYTYYDTDNGINMHGLYKTWNKSGQLIAEGEFKDGNHFGPK